MFKFFKILVLIVVLPIPFMTFLFSFNNLNYNDSLFYEEKIYESVEENDFINNFVFYAYEANAFDGEIIGRNGLKPVFRLESKDVIYENNLIGENRIYTNFDINKIPTAEKALKYTVSMHYRGDTEKNTDVVISKDASKVMKVLDDASQNTAVDYYSVDWNQFYCYQVCMDCKEFAGYYVIGYIYIGDGINYFRSCENMDICYEVSLEQITE